MVATVLVVLSVMLASPFGEASATAIAEDNGLELEVTVEMDRASEAVLVRPFSSFEELDPTAMVHRGDGLWGARVVVPSAENWSIVFESIDADGSVVRSDTTNLLELGVDPIVLDGEPTPVPSTSSSAPSPWLIAAIVLAVLALAVLAWWAFAPDKTSGDEDPSTSI